MPLKGVKGNGRERQLTEQIMLLVTKNLWNVIDQTAKKYRISRSVLIRMCIVGALEDRFNIRLDANDEIIEKDNS